MWLKRALAAFREIAKAAREPLTNEQECESYAAAAYDFSVGLYGPPADAGRPYSLITGVGNHSGCSYSFNKYLITLSPGLKTREQQCMLIGHEIYHRVTACQRGLRRQPWIDEVLAFLTSLWFLRQQGFSSYADFIIQNCQEGDRKPDLAALRAYRPYPWYERLRSLSRNYPEHFYTDVEHVALALKQIVETDALCRIIKAETLEEWITSLPPEEQYGVCRLLEVESDTKKMPETTPEIHQFFNALVAKGDKASVVTELMEITRLQPSSGAAFFYLGRAYHKAEDFQATRDAYLTTLDLKFPDKWLPYNLASAYSSLEDYTSSATWYQEATRQDPDWARAYYFQGWALLKAGDLENARAAWDKAATLDDEDYARWAREALQENPLPADAADE